MFQDPTTCKVFASIASPIYDERNVVISRSDKLARFHPMLVPAGADRFVIAYPGGSIAVVDTKAMKITRVIRPPPCRQP
jgi:hypothetical protein